MSRIATFILARGGSKRIPKKNIVDFHGKPLIMWTVETAIALGFPVYVFTDMPEIQEMLDGMDLTVKEKLFENADGMHETGKELAAYNEEIKADHIILLQPTSPLRDVLKIVNWIEEYLDGDFDVGIACKKLDKGFYYQNYHIPLYISKYRNYNSGTGSCIHKETGSFYIFKADQIKNNHFVNANKLVIFNDPYDIDVNIKEDFR